MRPPWVNTSHAGRAASGSGATAGVDGHHHALAPELVGQLGDQLGPVDGRRVDPDLVGPGPQQAPGVVDGADAAADGEGDEHLLGGAGDHVHHGAAVVR